MQRTGVKLSWKALSFCKAIDSTSSPSKQLGLACQHQSQMVQSFRVVIIVLIIVIITHSHLFVGIPD